MRIILALSNQTKESNLLYHQAMPGKLHIDIVYPGQWAFVIKTKQAVLFYHELQIWRD